MAEGVMLAPGAEVHERLDGSLAVYYQGHCRASKPASLEAPALRVRNTARVIPSIANPNELATLVIAAKKALEPKASRCNKPRPDRPWRTPFKVHTDRG